VLALGAGIPAVTISASRYYTHKLTGLAGQFGGACRIADAAAPRFAECLREAIDAAWEEPGTVRASLRASAVRQVASGDAAFDELAERVEARVRRPPGSASAATG
jgi:hypothetical protein